MIMKEVLTPNKAGSYLNLHIRTIYHLVKEGKIPGRKIGGRWRVRKDTLDEWLSGRKTILSRKP